MLSQATSVTWQYGGNTKYTNTRNEKKTAVDETFDKIMPIRRQRTGKTNKTYRKLIKRT